MLVGVIIEALGLVILIIYQGLATNNAPKLCTDPVFLILRAGGELITFTFAGIGV